MVDRDPLTKEEIQEAFEDWQGLRNALILGMTGLPEVEGVETQRETLIVILIGELTRERKRLAAARERILELERRLPLDSGAGLGNEIAAWDAASDEALSRFEEDLEKG